MNTPTRFEHGEVIENTRAHVDPNYICDGCVHYQPMNTCALHENKLNKKKECVDTVFAPIHYLIFGIRE